MTLIIKIPYPSRALGPNGGHGHWSTKHTAKKAYKADGYHATLEAMGRNRPKFPESGEIPVRVRWQPKARRNIDMDNCIASLKSGFDGIAEALGVNDSRFRLTFEMGEPVKGGAVTITVEVPE